MLFATDPGTKMDHSSLVKFKINNGGTTQIANMCAGQRRFALHAGKFYNLSFYQLQTALFIEAAIRGTKIDDPLFSILLNPQFNTWTGIKI
jgi:hypothetical protein